MSALGKCSRIAIFLRDGWSALALSMIVNIFWADFVTISLYWDSVACLRFVMSEVGDWRTRFVTVLLESSRGTTLSKLDSGYLQPGKLVTEL